MRRSLTGVLPVIALLAAAHVFAQGQPQIASPNTTPTQAQLNQKAKAANAPEIPYESVPNFFKMPENLYFGEGIAVATNSKGHVFVYTRSERTRLFEFDEKGNYVRELGEGLYGFLFAHAVRVDKEDNIWAVDEGSNMAIKFNPEGRVVMTIGRRPEAVEGLEADPPPGTPPPNAQPYALGRPTDIGWDAQGNIYISDGYTNSRVVKYDKWGKFIKSVGTRGAAPGQMNTPHSMQVDEKGNVYVADRGNNRIQVFDSNLTLRAIYDHVGQPWTLCISPGPHQYLYSSNSYPDNNNNLVLPWTGEIYKMELDGTVIGKFGKAGKQLGQFSTTHGIDCRNPNELFISEITSWRVQKILLKPGTAPTTTSAAR
jgi:sugar lactone lactonase YvrE